MIDSLSSPPAAGAHLSSTGGAITLTLSQSTNNTFSGVISNGSASTFAVSLTNSGTTDPHRLNTYNGGNESISGNGAGRGQPHRDRHLGHRLG